MKLNIYVLSKHKDIFVEKLKENPIVNDIFLSEERLEKTKVIVTFNKGEDLYDKIIKMLPDGAMLTDTTKRPSKEYALCVGEILEKDFYLIGNDIHSIINKSGERIKFNSWIKEDDLSKYYQAEKIINFTKLSE